MSFDEYWTNLQSAPATVLHTCSCGRRRTIHELFFCAAENCCRFVCDRCTQVNIDTYFCPACLNSCFSSTAIKTKNRCETCLECPICFHTLTAVSSTSSAGGSATPASVHEYVCESCEWSSMSVGISGASAAAAIAKAVEMENEKSVEEEFGRISRAVSDRYKQTIKEKQLRVDPNADPFAIAAANGPNPLYLSFDKPRVDTDGDLFEAIDNIERALRSRWNWNYRLPAYHSTPSASSNSNPNTAVAAAAQGKRAGNTTVAPAAATAAAATASAPSSSHPFTVVPDHLSPPTHLYGVTQPIDVHSISTLTQRLSRPAVQPSSISKLLPRRKHLLTKLAHRCNKCSKFVLKPSALAANVNFDSKNLAVSAVPRITLGPLPELKKDSPAKLTVYFKNPALCAMKMVLSTTPPPAASSVLGLSLTSIPPIQPTAAIAVSPLPVTLAEFDDIAEQEDAMNSLVDSSKKADAAASPATASAAAAADAGDSANPAVAYRHLSKVGLVVTVTPLTDRFPVQCSFTVSLTAAGDAKTAEFKNFAFETILILGSNTSSAAVSSH